MKKHKMYTKVRLFNRKKFPTSPGLDYSGKTLYLVGWCVTSPVRQLAMCDPATVRSRHQPNPAT